MIISTTFCPNPGLCTEGAWHKQFLCDCAKSCRCKFIHVLRATMQIRMALTLWRKRLQDRLEAGKLLLSRDRIINSTAIFFYK